MPHSLSQYLRVWNLARRGFVCCRLSLDRFACLTLSAVLCRKRRILRIVEVPEVRRFPDRDVKGTVRQASVFQTFLNHFDRRIADRHRFTARRVDARDVGGLNRLAEKLFVRIAEFERVRNQLIQLSLLLCCVCRRETAVRVLDTKNRNRADRV